MAKHRYRSSRRSGSRDPYGADDYRRGTYNRTRENERDAYDRRRDYDDYYSEAKSHRERSWETSNDTRDHSRDRPRAPRDHSREGSRISRDHSRDYSKSHWSRDHDFSEKRSSHRSSRVPERKSVPENDSFEHKWQLLKVQYSEKVPFDPQPNHVHPYTGQPLVPPSIQSKKPNCHVIYDPELDKHLRHVKGKLPLYRFEGKGLSPVTDPRLAIKENYTKYCLSKKSKHSYYKALMVPVFNYDKHSVGDKPSNELVVWNFPVNLNLGIIKSNFAKYGSISDAVLVTDPISATPLGVCMVRFDDNDGRHISEAHKSVLTAIRDAHDKLIIDRHRVRCGINTKKNRLLESKKSAAISAFQKKKEKQQKAMEIEKVKKIQIEEKKRAEAEKLAKRQFKEQKLRERKKLDMLKPKTTMFKGDITSEHVAKVVIPEKIATAIGSRPFFFLANPFYPTKCHSVKDLKARLSRYEWSEIFESVGLGYFVVFENRNSATRCFNEQNNRVFHLVKAKLQLCLDASSFEVQREISIDPLEDAADQIFRDLKTMLRKDIKERTIGPYVLSYLNSERFQKQAPVVTTSHESTPKPEIQGSDDVFGIGNFAPKLKLPSFRKKNQTASEKRTKLRRMLEDSDDEHEPVRKKRKEHDEDRMELDQQEKEEEEMEEEEKEIEIVDLETQQKKLIDVEKQGEGEVKEEQPKTEESMLHTKTLGETLFPEVKLGSHVTFKDLQSLINDDEDIELLKEVFAPVKPALIGDYKYWCWRAFNYDDGNSNMIAELENKTGSARSEGYKKIREELKAEYLPHRRKIHRHEPLNTLKNGDEEKESTVNSSRVNRANSRRLANDTKQILGEETDILKLNSLNKRKKPVNFARSAIHNWGLYALEPIAANEMIIEYVGDSIRQQVAEQREKQYLKSGIGSSYLFRIDEQTVIDATKKGGIARFINHCCTPSCTAKIIKVDGKKRIVIYALKDIKANEELTYDYKFERESNDEERIVCLCGAPGCKGFLN